MTSNQLKKLKIPVIPKYILFEDGTKMPIHALFDETLREIGKEWTYRLVRNANEQRDDIIRERRRQIRAQRNAIQSN